MLPHFRYHPDPIATGNVKASEVSCANCGRNRGYIYVGPIYSAVRPRNSICPWCIADGSVASKFNAMFTDNHSLIKAGLTDEIIEEVTKRTPGFTSWQPEVWLTCCNDACEFHGDAQRRELLELKGETLAETLSVWKCGEEHWKKLIQYYTPAGDPAIYKFACRHCGRIQFGIDCS